ncbi:MAG: hypothetical protein FWD26_11160 [Treponema sp.]|nr:hypothetical protein [Treponema sp.]
MARTHAEAQTANRRFEGGRGEEEEGRIFTTNRTNGHERKREGEEGGELARTHAEAQGRGGRGEEEEGRGVGNLYVPLNSRFAADFMG